MARTLFVVTIALFIAAAPAISQFPEEPFVGVPLPKVYDNLACRQWKWAEACRQQTKFSIESDWPSFLTYKAWDSCQGCKSAGGFAHNNDGGYPADNSAESFQVVGDWMRISSLEQGSTVTLSGSNNISYWFNPPRTGTTDKPLEMEWYFYMDASDFGDDLTSLTKQNWAAFWAFGHGKDGFGWPTGGEWDLVEWLPEFAPDASATKGATTGFHNAISGAYPPCCMKDDGVTYPLNTSSDTLGVNAASDQSGLLWPYTSKFRNWGQAINLAAGKEPGMPLDADAQTYNTVVHVYARCTTTQFDVWIKRGADPKNPPAIDASTDPGKAFGYAHAFRAYGDFGSNQDTSFPHAFPDKPGQNPIDSSRTATNWHQNMAFVWAIVRFPNEDTGKKKLLFYLSDIHIKGGSNGTEGQAPPGVSPSKIADAIYAQDSVDPCTWVSGGIPGCNNRLSYFNMIYHPKDYGQHA